MSRPTPASSSVRFGPEVSRILFVKNLPFKTTGADLYKIFGRFGSIRQVRMGNTDKTRGTAFVVFDEMVSAKRANDKLTGFNVEGRFLIVMYFHGKRRTAGGEEGEGVVASSS